MSDCSSYDLIRSVKTLTEFPTSLASLASHLDRKVYLLPTGDMRSRDTDKYRLGFQTSIELADTILIF